MMKWKLLLMTIPFLGLVACEGMFGTKEDETIEEIFEEGEIDPTLVPQNVGYVPIQPVWGNFDEPTDVYVGYDEMVYVVDKAGVHILDLKGEEHRLIEIPNATEVVQDRRIHTYVIGTIDVEVEGQMRTLSAVYRLGNTAGSGEIVYHDTIIHPFSDVSRSNTSFRSSDEEVRFTGVAPMWDNRIYVSRTGPNNNPASTSRPDNAVLIFDKEGNNTTYARGLSPTTSNLKSAMGISGIANAAAPPQLVFGMPETQDFVYCLKGTEEEKPEFGVLYITVTFNPNAGTSYEGTPSLTQFDYDNAKRFLYESDRFDSPEDIYIAPDRRHIFVVDSGLDSLYQFTISGEEGVNPPANSNEDRNIIVSFGGEGQGPFQFDDPSGVCYFREMVYVADKGNNRVLRYRLNTDLE